MEPYGFRKLMNIAVHAVPMRCIVVMQDSCILRPLPGWHKVLESRLLHVNTCMSVVCSQNGLRIPALVEIEACSSALS
jgi:hypothetical protein